MKSSKRADQELQPIIDAIAPYRGQGILVAIREEFDRRTHGKTRRENFEWWLHPDPRHRHEPRFSAGLVLVEVARKVLDEIRSGKRVMG